VRLMQELAILNERLERMQTQQRTTAPDEITL
jgi:hypothetical protein